MSMLAKFESRRRMFLFLIGEGVQILRKEGDEYFVYCDTASVPENVKDELATVLADMTLSCPIRILIGGRSNVRST